MSEVVLVRWCTMQTAGLLHGPVLVFYWTINHPCIDETVVYIFWTQEQQYKEEKLWWCQIVLFSPQAFQGFTNQRKVLVSRRKKKLFTRINENLSTEFCSRKIDLTFQGWIKLFAAKMYNFLFVVVHINNWLYACYWNIAYSIILPTTALI